MTSFLFRAASIAAAFALSAPAMGPVLGGPSEDIERTVARLEASLADQNQQQARLRGERTYSRTCAPCHGMAGQADAVAAEGLEPRPRNFALGQFRFRSTPSGALPRPEDIERTIRAGLPGSAMPAFEDLFSKGEISDLVSFVYSLVPEARRSTSLPEAVSLPAVSPPTPAMIEEGRRLFLALECWSCHGVEGNGRGASAEGLTDETGHPIRPTDFRTAPLKGGRRPEAVIRALLTGLNGTPMPSYDEALVFGGEDLGDASSYEGRLPRKAMEELDAFIRSLPTKAEIEKLDEKARMDLRDHRLAALAHYVLTLDRRHGLWFWLFHERPELEERAEGRKPRERP